MEKNGPIIRIILTQDEIQVLEKLYELLRDIGYKVPVSPEWRNNVSKLENGEINVLTLNVRLADELEGIALVAEIRRDFQEVSLILINFSKYNEGFSSAARDKEQTKFIELKGDQKLRNGIDLNVELDTTPQPQPKKEHKYSDISNTSLDHAEGHIFLRNKTRHVRVNFEEVLWAVAQSNYVKIVTEQGDYVLAVTLQKLHKYLDAPYFARVHRSFIVNLNKVDSLTSEKLYIKKEEIPVSKKKREEIFDYFEII